MRHRHAGYVLYEGISRLDKLSPVVVIATGFEVPSSNRKTGAMIQVFCLRSDQHPLEAIMKREDAAICGGCPLRRDREGKRRCYVNIRQHGVAAVYGAYKAGRYPRAPDLALLGSKQRIRVGSYGDPAAVPIEIWQQLLLNSTGHTGYTHAWRKHPELMPYVQASVDNEAEYLEASGLGWGTYRIRASEEDPIMTGEMVCPASPEGGEEAQCSTCLQCNGQSNVVIVAHGPSRSYFQRSLPVLTA